MLYEKLLHIIDNEENLFAVPESNNNCKVGKFVGENSAMWVLSILKLNDNKITLDFIKKIITNNDLNNLARIINNKDDQFIEIEKIQENILKLNIFRNFTEINFTILIKLISKQRIIIEQI